VHGGYGNLVVIDHLNGWETWYAHLSKVSVVCGQEARAGEIIGLGGSTGWSTGPHLHFEMRLNGVPQDPFKYLP
jgi:murein DD-endopeptidase MepM/ murein hydrolase activator NlpD